MSWSSSIFVGILTAVVGLFVSAYVAYLAVGWYRIPSFEAGSAAFTVLLAIAGLVGGFTRRQSFNSGAALIAHGEFTIILAQLAAGNSRLSDAVRSDLTAFAGLYVLATATIGVIVMKESKWIGRRLISVPRLAEE